MFDAPKTRALCLSLSCECRRLTRSFFPAVRLVAARPLLPRFRNGWPPSPAPLRKTHAGCPRVRLQHPLTCFRFEYELTGRRRRRHRQHDGAALRVVGVRARLGSPLQPHLGLFRSYFPSSLPATCIVLLALPRNICRCGTLSCLLRVESQHARRGWCLPGPRRKSATNPSLRLLKSLGSGLRGGGSGQLVAVTRGQCAAACTRARVLVLKEHCCCLTRFDRERRRPGAGDGLNGIPWLCLCRP